jgi:putative glutamine amidotransferase
VSAWAPDGLVEGLEGDGVMAVQWHPELLFERHPEHLEPFRLLIRMCLARTVAV